MNLNLYPIIYGVNRSNSKLQGFTKEDFKIWKATYMNYPNATFAGKVPNSNELMKDYNQMKVQSASQIWTFFVAQLIT